MFICITLEKVCLMYCESRGRKPVMNCSVLQQLLNGCLRSSAQYVVFRFHLQEQLRMQSIFSGVLYFSSTAAVWTDFTTLTRERALELCYTSWCPLTWQRTAAENNLTAQKEKWKWFFPFFLFSHCFKINFGSDLQKLRCQKHMYFRFHLCRVGKLLSVYFHSGEHCNFPDIKSPKVLITTEFDPSHLLGKSPTLFFS